MQNYVITITRQFGSRGRDIGIATAKKLGPMLSAAFHLEYGNILAACQSLAGRFFLCQRRFRENDRKRNPDL